MKRSRSLHVVPLVGEVVESPRARAERFERALRELEAAAVALWGADARVVPVVYGANPNGLPTPTPPAVSHPKLRVVREAA